MPMVTKTACRTLPRSRGRLAVLLVAVLGGLGGTTGAAAQPSLRDYKYLRALSIDLVGRMPTRQEIAQLERDNFSFDAWIDDKLGGRGYAERLRTVYMDRLRLEVHRTVTFEPDAVVLRRQLIIGPDGPLYVYFRKGQRRVDEATDGTFCLTAAQTGLRIAASGAPTGTPSVVPRAALARATVRVRPWWLDAASDLAAAQGLLLEADGSTPTTEVVVCKEEAQAALFGTVLATGRVTRPSAGTPPPHGRAEHPPIDSPFARANGGTPINCTTAGGLSSAADCGCGERLERCLPLTSWARGVPSFTAPSLVPYRLEHPYEVADQRVAYLHRLWWTQEAVRFLDRLLTEDRDFREVLTSRATVINGPLAQFYRSTASARCCGIGAYLGYVEPQLLFEPARVPALHPGAMTGWTVVEDRGPLASGLLTMPVFLVKHATRRARANAIYETFLCKSFVAGTTALEPSDEPNLMRRPGCSACHAILEPMAAFFARIAEFDWTYLPPEYFPARSAQCALQDNGALPRDCREHYDPVFSTADSGALFAAHASEANADAGPAGLAAQVVGSPRFARCVCQTMAGAFLGRPMVAGDDPLLDRLTDAFVDGGYRMTALVGRLVREDVYRRANNGTPAAWRSRTPAGAR